MIRNTLLCGLVAAAATVLVPSLAHAQSSPSPYTSATRYDIVGRITGIIAPDPDGIGTGSLNFPAVRNSYDAAGRLIKVESGELANWKNESIAPSAWGTDFSVLKTVDTTYDALDRKLTVKVSNGTKAALTQFSYDGDGRLECTAVRMNSAIYGSLPGSACTLGTQGADGPDRISKNLYDAAGQLLQVIDGFGSDVEATEATFTYSPNGKKLTLRDANGNLATFVYDPFDRQAAWRFPSAANGLVSASCNIGTYSEVSGVSGPSETRNATDDCEKYAYDRNGNRRTLVKRDGSVLRYTYDTLNRMTVKDVPTRDVYYAYDLRGLMLSAKFDSASGADSVTSTYNGFGDLTSSQIAMSGFSKTLNYAYANAAMIDREGHRLELTYPDGQKFTYARDGLNRVSNIYEGTSLVAANQLIAASYNPRGTIASVQRATSGNALLSSFTYDDIGRLVSIANNAPGTANDLTHQPDL